MVFAFQTVLYRSRVATVLVQVAATDDDFFFVQKVPAQVQVLLVLCTLVYW